VYEYEIVRLTTKIAGRSPRPNKSSNAIKVLVLERSSRNGAFVFSPPDIRGMLMMSDDCFCVRIEEVLLLSEWINRGQGWRQAEVNSL